jgi:hypothetical protein
MGIDVDDVDPAAFLEDDEMRVGEVTGAEPFPEADTDLCKLEVVFGVRSGRRRWCSPTIATPGTWSVGRFSPSATSVSSLSPGSRAGVWSPGRRRRGRGRPPPAGVPTSALQYCTAHASSERPPG